MCKFKSTRRVKSELNKLLRYLAYPDTRATINHGIISVDNNELIIAKVHGCTTSNTDGRKGMYTH